MKKYIQLKIVKVTLLILGISSIINTMILVLSYYYPGDYGTPPVSAADCAMGVVQALVIVAIPFIFLCLLGLTRCSIIIENREIHFKRFLKPVKPLKTEEKTAKRKWKKDIVTFKMEDIARIGYADVFNERPAFIQKGICFLSGNIDRYVIFELRDGSRIAIDLFWFNTDQILDIFTRIYKVTNISPDGEMRQYVSVGGIVIPEDESELYNLRNLGNRMPNLLALQRKKDTKEKYSIYDDALSENDLSCLSEKDASIYKEMWQTSKAKVRKIFKFTLVSMFGISMLIGIAYLVLENMNGVIETKMIVVLIAMYTTLLGSTIFLVKWISKPRDLTKVNFYRCLCYVISVNGDSNTKNLKVRYVSDGDIKQGDILNAYINGSIKKGSLVTLIMAEEIQTNLLSEDTSWAKK